MSSEDIFTLSFSAPSTMMMMMMMAGENATTSHLNSMTRRHISESRKIMKTIVQGWWSGYDRAHSSDALGSTFGLRSISTNTTYLARCLEAPCDAWRIFDLRYTRGSTLGLQKEL